MQKKKFDVSDDSLFFIPLMHLFIQQTFMQQIFMQDILCPTGQNIYNRKQER